VTVQHAARGLPPRSLDLPVLRRAALLLGVLPTVGAILVITLGPRWLVVDSLTLVMRLLDGLGARTGWAMDVDRVETIANAAMFVPLGASLGLAVRPVAWPAVLLLGAALSVGVEVAQSSLPGRVPDVHDVVANVCGDVLGVALAMLVVGLVRTVLIVRRAGRR
jgi:glycopeptide antibiotics resistance protein